MMIDIFQYSNMYTLRKNIQWLADEPHVKEECGPYVTKPGTRSLFSISLTFPNQICLGRAVTDWPQLLHLYSRLRPGRTVVEWMEEYNVNELGVDVRRFTSFGVIKVLSRLPRGLVTNTALSVRDSCAESTDGRCCCLKIPMQRARRMLRQP